MPNLSSIPRCEGPSPLIIQGDVSKEEDCCRCPHCIDALSPQIHSSLFFVFPGRKCYLKKKIISFFVLILPISLSLGLLPRLWKNLADWMCWYFDFIFSAEIARTMLGLQVNNAGVLEMGTIETTSLEQYDRWYQHWIVSLAWVRGDCGLWIIDPCSLVPNY